jgi:hypothetical protein
MTFLLLASVSAKAGTSSSNSDASRCNCKLYQALAFLSDGGQFASPCSRR